MWNILIINCITNSYIWNTFVTGQSIDYRLPEDDTIVSKYVGGVIICETILNLLVIVLNKNVAHNYLKWRFIKFVHRLYLQLFFYLLVCYNTREMPCLTKKEYYHLALTFLKRSGYLQSSTDCITRRQRPDICLTNDTTAKGDCCNIPASIFRERRLMNNPNQTSHVKHVNGAREFVFNWDRIRKYFNLFVTR